MNHFIWIRKSKSILRILFIIVDVFSRCDLKRLFHVMSHALDTTLHNLLRSVRVFCSRRTTNLPLERCVGLEHDRDGFSGNTHQVEFFFVFVHRMNSDLHTLQKKVLISFYKFTCKFLLNVIYNIYVLINI